MAAGLSGCDGAAGGKGRVLHVLVGADPSHAAARRAWMARIEREFTAETGATVSFDTFSSAGDEQTRIQSSILSGTGPDIYSIGTTFTPVAYATGSFRVLTGSDWKRIGGRDKFMPSALAMSGPDAQHDIGVPLSERPYGMLYNTALFHSAGISSPPKTWDQFLTDAKKLTNRKAGVYGTAMDYADPYDPWKFIWTFALQSGARLTSDNVSKAQLDDPRIAGAVDHYFDFLGTQHVVDPASVGWNSAQATAAFAAGKAAMLPMVNPQAAATLEKSAVRGTYRFVPLPLVPFGATARPHGGLAAGSIVSGDNLVVAGYTKHANLAMDFLALVTSTPEQKYYNRAFGDLPSVASAARGRVASDSRIAEYIAAEKTSIPTTFSGAWAQIQLGLGNVVAQSLPALAKGGYDPSAVRRLLSTANDTVQSSLNEQRH
ncbi:ABC transporter substrate-binding protein [Streptomyces sp. NBC_00344]|uniref:ABC transporter substrate-binding protein n=1 Tax=Streptomyces sp. NBC_00344 TaxID=2975720 RepID=UPI002E23E6D2